KPCGLVEGTGDGSWNGKRSRRRIGHDEPHGKDQTNLIVTTSPENAQRPERRWVSYQAMKQERRFEHRTETLRPEALGVEDPFSNLRSKGRRSLGAPS
ncbi:MAG: hypothetical protein AAFS10_21150, partial [Myxococcota bacterium]